MGVVGCNGSVRGSNRVLQRITPWWDGGEGGYGGDGV